MLLAAHGGCCSSAGKSLPNCRSARAPLTTIAKLKREAHCDVCQIRFDAEFDKSVELKFTVHPSVQISDQTFCLAPRQTACCASFCCNPAKHAIGNGRRIRLAPAFAT